MSGQPGLVVSVSDAPEDRAAQAAAVLAGQLRLGVEVCATPSEPATVDALVALLSAPTTTMGVMPAPAEPWPDWFVAALRSPAPVVVLGPACDALSPAGLRRIIVPVDGSSATGAAVARASALLAGLGIDELPVHVLVEETVPPHLDQPQHGYADLSSRLLRRSALGPTPRLLLEQGDIVGRILARIASAPADLVVVAWSQDLTDGRARVVRALIAQSPVPLLCVPTTTTAVSPAPGAVPSSG